MYDGKTSKPSVYADKQVCACEYSVCKAESFACMAAEILFWKWKNMLMSNSRTCQTAIFDGTTVFLFIYLFLSIKQKCFLHVRKCSLPQKKVHFPETHNYIPLEMSFISIFHIDKVPKSPPTPPPPCLFHHTAVHCCVWCVESRN